MLHFDRREIESRLTYDICIPAMKKAMTELAGGGTKQIPRAVIELSPGRLLGVMAGDIGEGAYFGTKAISVFHENQADGRPSHQGLVILFDPQTGAPVCTADAYAITAIRTAAASAAATDVLARKDATRLAILGYGEQAARHAQAICAVRPISEIRVWGRSAERAAAFAERISKALDIKATAFLEIGEATSGSDIICTVTAASDPVLFGQWVSPGVHINAVGSSLPAYAEVDGALVAKARFIADCRQNVLIAGGEFLRAQKAGLVSEQHIIAEVGDVYSGKAVGRHSANDITIYKSLGHIVQDLAAVECTLNLSHASENAM